MRTTLTLDEDVAAALKAESRRTGQPFREIVNEMLRQGLASRGIPTRQQRFKVKARDLGNLKPGLSLDNMAELIDLDDPLTRITAENIHDEVDFGKPVGKESF